MDNKKAVIAISLVFLVGAIGLTIAYFSKTATMKNKFEAGIYGTDVDEVFVSPDDWIPGTTTDKILVVTNTGY